MARGRSHRVLRDPNAKPLLYILPLLLSAAAILRLSAIQLGYTHSILLASACWSAAFAGLFVWLLWLTQMEREEQPSA
jgi:hypothetical protein